MPSLVLEYTAPDAVILFLNLAMESIWLKVSEWTEWRSVRVLGEAILGRFASKGGLDGPEELDDLINI